MVSLFCRHNRFTADCPICSRGTVLDTASPGASRSTRGGGTAAGDDTPARRTATRRSSEPRRRDGSRPPADFRGPYASAGPYERDGATSEVRLERVPGGLRLAEWAAERLRPFAPVLRAVDLATLVEAAAHSQVLEPRDHAALADALEAARDRRHEGGAASDGQSGAASEASSVGESRAGAGPPGHGASPGRSGELREELRVERLDGDRIRVARWVLRPGTGWDLLDAPTMLPARRYAEALADAGRRGLLTA